MGRRSKFDSEFRCHAVEMVQVSGRPRYQIATDLGISDTTLAKWMRQQNEDSGETPLTISERAELEMLRSEKREWIMERDILKRQRPSG